MIFFIYLLFAVRFCFIPFGRISKHIKKKKGLGSLMVLLGSSMGVGNIVGVGLAIYLAGPGVIFWMFISAIVSATTNYLEVYFSKQKATPSFNPVSYIEHKGVSILYTILMIITALFIGNMTQVNSIKLAFSIINPSILLVLLVLLFIICTYNYENISRTLQVIMPFASLIYLSLGVCLLIIQRDNLLESIKLIFTGAFNPKATLGIPFFYVFNQGVLFAIFSNEAGNGSSAMAFKDSDGDAEELGIIASLGPIIDTAVICVLTGLIILSNDLFKGFNYQNYNPNAYIYIIEIYHDSFGIFGKIVMSLLIFLFAFATLISWFYYARLGVKYLNIKVYVFYIVYVFLICLSMFLKLTLLMNLANYFNLCLLMINLSYLFKKVFVSKLSKND